MGMKMFKVVDYCDSHFEELPPRRGGKFIQLKDERDEFIVFSPSGHTVYHANIAEEFFRSQNVEGRYNARQDHFTHDDDGWKIVGGGHWSVDEHSGTLELFGTSIAYGRFNDDDELARKLGEAEKFKGLKVIILEQT